MTSEERTAANIAIQLGHPPYLEHVTAMSGTTKVVEVLEYLENGNALVKWHGEATRFNWVARYNEFAGFWESAQWPQYQEPR